jgi:hypothetical protein
MSEKQVKHVSGPWLTVGPNHDLLALNIDLAPVLLAGRRKSTSMPMRYGAVAIASSDGMARAATKQRRDVMGVSDFLCLSHTLDQEAEYGDQERDFG